MLILLIGPKGSGKSHIGRLLESRCGIHFFHVEPHWIKFNEECAAQGKPIDLSEGIKRIHPKIAAALETHQDVCVETTGASTEILEDLCGFGESFPCLHVKVEAPWSVCFERIASRDTTDQIPMELEQIRKVFELSRAVELPFDLTLNNVGLSEAEILQPFAEVGIASGVPTV